MSDAYELIKNKKLFLLDMDGTIYHENTLIDGAVDFIESLKNNGRNWLFMTNNSSKSASSYLKKLQNLGVPADEKNIFTSGQAAALFLSDLKKNATVYVMGTKSLQEELTKSGFDVRTEVSDDIDFLLVGYDTELTYKKLEDACALLIKDIPFYATNPDVVCPAKKGTYLPDCATMCYMLEKATGKTPFYIGKPRAEMAYTALSLFGVKKEDAVIIGDRIYTDIKCGENAKVHTVMVLSGESTRADIEKYDIHPTAITSSVKDLILK